MKSTTNTKHENSRTEKALKNTTIALCDLLFSSVMHFINRTVFIYILGKTYLGLSGLFSDILTLLSLAELGVSSAIVYLMYEPAANKEYEKIAALLNEYKKIYYIVGFFITAAGILLIPFLGFFISDIPQLPELPFIYLLCLLNVSVGYFFIYKRSILIIDQKNYVFSLIEIIANFIQNALQIVFLLSMRNYIIYLMINVVCTLGNNITVSVYVNRKYTYIKEYSRARIDRETKKALWINVKAMFLSKLSSAIVTSTDNILISKFVSTVILGFYSNYTLFVKLFRSIIGKLFDALTGSVGNMIVLESKDKIYQNFRRIWFVNYWLVSFLAISFHTLINSFINLWIGEAYLLESKVVFLICLNLYMRLIRNTFLAFIDTYGLFVEIRIKCIAEASINLVASLIFIKIMRMGICGVLLGTFVSNILTNFWYEPYLLFVKKFDKKLTDYFCIFLKYFIVMMLSDFSMYCLGNYIICISGWGGFIIKGIMCCVVINVVFFAFYHRTVEFEYLIEVFRDKLLKRIL
ncbi:MAG: hypothetical protein NC489_35365 [Ruminococcus flavefaciens]|nr:hypothetical protein [Ruminococcus flavefaciens]